MKLPKILLLTGFVLFSQVLLAQSPEIVGTWQLIQHSNCLEEATSGQESVDGLRAEMQSRSSASPQVVSFKSNSSGEESTRILNSARTANTKKFLYKFSGDMLLILDKKSQTISASYLVDKFTADSLILSNSSRPCEVRIFAKISE